MVIKCVPIPQKMYNKTKRLKTPEEVEKYFPGFLAFIDCTEQQIPRPMDKNRRKIFYSGKKKDIPSKIRLWLTIMTISFIKQIIKKGKRQDYDIYKNNQPVTPKQVINVVDLGYLGIETDSPEQLLALPYKKKIHHECLKKKKSITKFIPKRE